MSRAKKITSGEVAAFLEDRARRLDGQAPIFYGDLAAHFGLPPVTEAWFTHPLCGIFEDLDVEDAKRGTPFRTALVISKEHSIPGPGFFKAIAKLCPKRKQPKTDFERIQFYTDEVNRLLRHYAKT